MAILGHAIEDVGRDDAMGLRGCIDRALEDCSEQRRINRCVESFG